MSEYGRGITPAVALINPKYPRNVGMTVRTCALLGVDQLWYTGTRAEAVWREDRRLPREERLAAYQSVELIHGQGRWLSMFPPGTVPVAVEVHPTAEVLGQFVHPVNAVYIFGPEDGSLDRGMKTACHRFLVLPSDGPLNLAVAVGAVLMDRRTQLTGRGLEPARPAAALGRPA